MKCWLHIYISVGQYHSTKSVSHNSILIWLATMLVLGAQLAYGKLAVFRDSICDWRDASQEICEMARNAQEIWLQSAGNHRTASVPSRSWQTTQFCIKNEPKRVTTKKLRDFQSQRPKKSQSKISRPETSVVFVTTSRFQKTPRNWIVLQENNADFARI